MMRTTVLALAVMLCSAPVRAGSFVYVSNAEDGDIGTYALQADGSLKPGERVAAQKLVMPLAVSPDKRFLVGAARSKPYQAWSYAVDPGTGALRLIGQAPLPESYPYISFDRRGRFLLGASYGGNAVGVSAFADGRVGQTLQVVPTARNAHSIRTDNSNKFVFVPHLGTDQIFQFKFDADSGRLTANTPPVLQLEQGTGPRHFVVSNDNRFVYLLSEMAGTVTTLALDASTGLLKKIDVASILPPDTKLVPGVPRGAVGTPGANQATRDTANDIWAADLHLTPDGRFLYASERTSGVISGLRVDPATGKLSYLGSMPTERQPRGFAIDPHGRFMVVSGELSDTISTYSINAGSGALKLVGRYPAGKGANWVEIVEFD
jgi:6-phosphogluconolactonase